MWVSATSPEAPLGTIWEPRGPKVGAVELPGGFTVADKATVVLGSELQPKMHGRQVASCILELVCQPLVMVLTKSMRRCG